MYYRCILFPDIFIANQLYQYINSFTGLFGNLYSNRIINDIVSCHCKHKSSNTITLPFRFAHIHGFIGLLCGYLVALKQAYPDSVAFPPPAPPTLRILVTIKLKLFIDLLLSLLSCSISHC